MFVSLKFAIAVILMLILIVSIGSVNAQSPASEKMIGPPGTICDYSYYDTVPFVGFTTKGDF